MPIVTPNWNLPTPALTDAYNLVGDLATLSSAVDGALTSVANAFKGTSAQRIAAAATSPDGVLWQDTDGIKMIWRRDGSVAGSWAPAVARWVGTTAQMNAFTQAPNGFSWYSTTDNSEYVRLSGAWSVGNIVRFRSAYTPTGTALTAPVGWGTANVAIPSPRGTTIPRVDSVEVIASDTGSVGWGSVADVTATTVTLRIFRIGVVPAGGNVNVTLNYS